MNKNAYAVLWNYRYYDGVRRRISSTFRLGIE